MITNLTPHQITIVDESGTIVRAIPSAGVARAAVTSTPTGRLDGVPLVAQTYGRPEGLPEPKPGVYLVVSLVTAQAAEAAGRDTDDLLLVADLVRDDAGRVIGCRALAPYAPTLVHLYYDIDALTVEVDGVCYYGDEGDLPEDVLADAGYTPVGSIDDYTVVAEATEYVGLVRPV